MKHASLVAIPRWFIALSAFGFAFMTGARAGEAKAARSLYFPLTQGEWAQVEPAKAGWDADKLNEALEFAHAQKSSGVVVLYRGRIMAEKYWDVDTKEVRYTRMAAGKDEAGRVIEDVASCQKSVASMLVGMAQKKGLLRIEDRVDKYLGKGWSKASPEQEEKITIRHLLTMTSGLKDDLTYEVPAGTKWFYNSAAYCRTVMAVAAAAKKPANDLTREWLTGRIGMTHSSWIERRAPDGREVANPLGFATTARDLARFGLLILADGQWNGETVIEDKEYLHAALHPSQELNKSYGYLWWLNGQAEMVRGAKKMKGPLIPNAPSDLVAALGALDRKVYVVPSLDLVVTRLGDATGVGFDNQFWKALSAAGPKK